MPSVNVSEDSSVNSCQYFWFTSETMAPEIPSRSKVAESIQIACDHEEVSGALRIQEMKGWTLRSTDRIFIPEERDAGRQVCLIVTPCNHTGRYGLPRIWTPPVEKATSSEVLKKGVVIAPPEAMVWTERHQLCADSTPNDSIRCVNYNILADLYMNLTVPDEEMYFPYCPRRYQTHNYRYPLLLKEISGYQADLYCLQEVDTRMYDRFLEAYMAKLGWRGVRKMKGGVVNEGSAIFYRPEKFELIDSDDHIISDLLAKDDSFSDLAQIAKQTELVWNIFFTRPAAVQVAVFRCLNVPNSFVCVGNTHLHFKPHHSPIRLLQAAVGYRHLLNVVSRIEKQYPNSTVAAIFCGDFNSTPSTGVYEMFQNGRLDAEHRDWKPEAEQVDDDDSEDEGPAEALVVQGINLTFSKRLRSACPPIGYTTLTHKFRGMLDHIFISDDLIVDRVVPMPRHDLVTKYTGLPSPICPSDHLPLICELKFR